MDYPNRRRIKIWGTAKVVEGDEELLKRLVDSNYRGKPERALVFRVHAWDVNCPQHIKPRWTEEEIAPVIDELRTRVVELEAENARLRAHNVHSRQTQVAESDSELLKLAKN